MFYTDQLVCHGAFLSSPLDSESHIVSPPRLVDVPSLNLFKLRYDLSVAGGATDFLSGKTPEPNRVNPCTLRATVPALAYLSIRLRLRGEAAH